MTSEAFQISCMRCACTFACLFLCEEGLFVEYGLVGKTLNTFNFEQNLYCHKIFVSYYIAFSTIPQDCHLSPTRDKISRMQTGQQTIS